MDPDYTRTFPYDCLKKCTVRTGSREVANWHCDKCESKWMECASGVHTFENILISQDPPCLLARACMQPALAQAALPPSTKDGKTMILVCGTDGFVAHWGGPIGRGPKKPDGSKGPKVQGPLLGVLAAAGFDESEVFKY